jgi:hypothetical protein
MNSAAEIVESELPRLMHDVTLAILGETGELETQPPTVEQRLSCAVGIHGGFEGEVVVTATYGLAALFASKMFEGELLGAPTARDALDALREVSNIVAGNLKPLLGDHNTLGLPREHASDTDHTRKGQLAEASSRLASGVLEVRVFAAL